MKNCNASEYQITRRIRVIAYGAALAVVFLVALTQPAYAGHPTPPDVPPEIAVPAGHKAYLEGHAIGTQQYVCLPLGSSSAWTFFGPQATLFKANKKQNITHFLSPNPFENNSPARATWQDSKDTSTNWAKDPNVVGDVLSSSDPVFVDPNAIPWLRLRVDAQDGPTGGDKLSETTYIHRVNTSGGKAPTGSCGTIGGKLLVDYTADYFFYKAHDED